MALETRFARAASGPVPYRVDGSGTWQLLIVSDWAQPYGEPGVGAFDAFTQALAAADARADVRSIVPSSRQTAEDRGAATLKGLPGEWLLLAVTAVR